MAIPLEQVNDVCWRIPQTGGMRVEGLIYTDKDLVKSLKSDGSLRQVANVAHLPGIVKASLAMPDIHQGYGFPIGGVAAMDVSDGVISPGGVGYDTNCGCRVITSKLMAADVRNDFDPLMDALSRAIPCGIGETGQFRLKVNKFNFMTTSLP